MGDYRLALGLTSCPKESLETISSVGPDTARVQSLESESVCLGGCYLLAYTRTGQSVGERPGR